MYRSQLMSDATQVATLFINKHSRASSDSGSRTRQLERAIQRSLAAGLFMNTAK